MGDTDRSGRLEPKTAIDDGDRLDVTDSDTKVIVIEPKDNV